MSGVERIQQVFAELKAKKQAAFMPYHAMGYPTRQRSLEVVEALAQSGADLFEIGIPHSDPLADGPTIQAATDAAIRGGTTVADCLAMMQELRAAGVTQPFCAMSYYNPILAYGEERFVRDAAAAGVDGLIVPDLPPGESMRLEPACREAGIATVYMLAPTSTEARIRAVTAHATGFIYLVSITGITGERTQLPPDLVNFVQRVRRHTALPLAVGFGIGNRAQAAEVAGFADGVIVGTAVVRAAGSTDGVEAVRRLATELAAGAHS
ncbi:MAG: tryptophan synthase subunit alpha [Caldilineaceae bacterium]|nr:tryptophan synthase subunit alpha [Caldilineaceae bacterium]HRJ43912.1 tryptophan synthase subunit alpha [Caldilineaceae bacterium]